MHELSVRPCAWPSHRARTAPSSAGPCQGLLLHLRASALTMLYPPNMDERQEHMLRSKAKYRLLRSRALVCTVMMCTSRSSP